MPVSFYRDVHIPAAISEQLRVRGVDVATATEEGTNELPDDELLAVATAAGSVVFTHDIGFRVMAEQWVREGRAFAGLAFGPAEGPSIGQYVRDLELIAKASEPEEWQNLVMYLPL